MYFIGRFSNLVRSYPAGSHNHLNDMIIGVCRTEIVVLHELRFLRPEVKAPLRDTVIYTYNQITIAVALDRHIKGDILVYTLKH